ncbi:MAG: hypothetical protein L3J21_09235 [Devosiaceae bacterium]|nr:hypothetical protein [Devosiaceae bacterium]
MPRYFFALVRHDILLQFRNGIYLAYGFVLAIYGIVLFSLGQYLPTWVVVLFVYSDPSALGVFFLGALIMLEKGEDTQRALAITPISASAYFWSKILTLTFASLIAASIIGIIFHPLLNWPLFLTTVTLVSISFIAIGFPIANMFPTVTSYMMGAGAIFIPIVIPMFFALMQPFPLWAQFIPAAAHFRLILASFGAYEIDRSQILLLLFTTLVFTLLCLWFGLRSIRREFART